MSSEVISPQRLQQSVRRLLTAPDDLIDCGARLAGSAEEQPGTEAHQELFCRYLAELLPCVVRALQWWGESMSWHLSQTGDSTLARTMLLEKHPAGPASDGIFIATIRKYWLACDELNASRPPREWVDPPRFLLKWAMQADQKLAVQVLASQPYWPVCMQRDGRWF